MIVIAGKKVVRKHLGWVGEFCPICRGLECVRVTRLTKVSHLYYLPLGKGQVVAHELECKGCETLFGATSVSYSQYARRPDRDVVGLIAATNPDAIERHNERLDLEDRIAEGQLTSEERLGLIAEPLVALEFQAARKVGKGFIPTGAGVCIIFLVFLVPGTLIAWSAPGTPIAVRVILSVLVLMLLATAAASFRRGGRAWVRKRLVPRLARSLAPLRPTQQELETVLAETVSERLVIGRRLNAAELWAAVERARMAPPQR